LLCHAARRGDEASTRTLLAAGAKPGVRTRDGNTALHIAAARNNVSVMRLLLTSGASPDERNGRGLTPLMLAAMAGHAAPVSLLIDSGATLKLVNSDNRTALDLAWHNHKQVAEFSSSALAAVDCWSRESAEVGPFD
jgi:ankyrin repeat protein